MLSEPDLEVFGFAKAELAGKSYFDTEELRWTFADGELKSERT
ncbi:MAG: hypothetical protein AAGN35_10555 [Bacteroidota bacterium]